MITKTKIGLLGLLAGVYAGGASAQDTNGASDALTLDEITVTARKREESVQDVPVAITAFSATTIAEAGIDDLGDLLDMTAGMAYNERDGNRATASPGVRGIKTFTNPGPTAQRVSSFVNGMPLAGSQATIPFMDVESAEVFRGPQSAVFGRSVYAGAINYNLRQPSVEESAGAVNAQFGQDGRQALGGWYTVPLVENKLGLYLSAATDSYDGPGSILSTNRADPSEQIRMGARDSKYYSVALTYQPTDRVEMNLRYTNTELDDGPAADYNLDPATDSSVVQQQVGYAAVYLGELNVIDNPTLYRNFCAHAEDCILDPGWELERDRLEFDLSLDVGEGHNLTFKAFTSDDTTFDVDDQDNTDDPWIPGGPPEVVNMGTDTTIDEDYAEVIWTSPDAERLRYTLGYSQYEYDESALAYFTHPSSDTVDGSGSAPSFSALSIENSGFFGGVFFDINDAFTASVEGRFQSDKIAGALTSVDSDNFLPRFSLSYAPSDSMNLYFQWSKGVQPAKINGGTQAEAQVAAAEVLEILGENPGAPALLEALALVDEEELTNVELGLKGTFLDGRANLNLAVFRIESDDYTETLNMFFWPVTNDLAAVQAAVDAYGCANAAYAVLCNAVGDTTGRVRGDVALGDLVSTGIEMDGTFLVNDNLTLQGSLTYMNVEFDNACHPGMSIDSYNLDNSVLTLPGGGTLGCLDISGNTFPYSPELQFAAAATYENSFTSNWDWFTRIDMRYEDKQYMDHRGLGWIPSSTRFNLRIGLNSENTRLEAYVVNLTDDRTPYGAQYEPDRHEVARNFAIRPGPGFATGLNIAVAQPREIGMRLSYQF